MHTAFVLTRLELHIQRALNSADEADENVSMTDLALCREGVSLLENSFIAALLDAQSLPDLLRRFSQGPVPRAEARRAHEQVSALANWAINKRHWVC